MLISASIIPYIVLVWIVGSLAIALIGINRKFGFWGYFFFSLIFTPVLGLILVMASDPKKSPKKLR